MMTHARLRAALLASLAAAGCTASARIFDDYTCEEAERWIDHLTLDRELDYLALRQIENAEWDPGAEGRELMSRGTACATATDVPACEAALADAWPTTDGWGECYDICVHHALVYTVGDEVGVAQSDAEVLAVLGTIDTPAEAVFMAERAGHTVDCEDAVQIQEDGTFHVKGSFTTSICELTYEHRLLEVDAAGNVTVLDVLDIEKTNACVGRRPTGLSTNITSLTDPLRRHLAEVAMLEAAAVVAFERLAADLERLGAPPELIERALRAAADEVDHAQRTAALARTHGVEPLPVNVEPHQERDLFGVALENAVEGCARETFGVADAMYRSNNAPTAELRSLFGLIARDETRHATLSWDVAAWAESQLADAQVRALDEARDQAFVDLITDLGNSDRTAIAAALGAPTSGEAIAMVQALRKGLDARLSA